MLLQEVQVWDHLRNLQVHKSMEPDVMHLWVLREPAEEVFKSLSMIFEKLRQSSRFGWHPILLLCKLHCSALQTCSGCTQSHCVIDKDTKRPPKQMSQNKSPEGKHLLPASYWTQRHWPQLSSCIHPVSSFPIGNSPI